MTDTEFHTLSLMAATLRAGKAGTSAKAWQEAIHEAVTGYGTMVSNRPTLEKIFAMQSHGAPKTTTVA